MRAAGGTFFDDRRHLTEQASPMLDLSLDPTQKRMTDELKAAAIELRPFAREAEDMGAIPAAVRTDLAKFGLPGADGFVSGANDPVSFCLAAESLAWSDAGIAYAWLASRQVAWVIAACGTEAQKAKWLPRFTEDPFLPASLYMYEGRGIAPSEVQTEVRAEGNHLVVNGYKSPVMYPSDAAVAVIVGRDADGHLTAVIAEEPGDAVTFSAEASGRRLGMTACPSALEAHIRQLAVPADAALKPDGLLDALTTCRMAHAAICIGAAAAATRYAGDYAQTRTAFGKPIIAYQAISFTLTDLYMEAEALRLSMLDVVTADIDPEARERQASAVIASANQLIADSGREGVQIMGAAGIVTDHPQERVYRNAAILASIDFDPLNSPLAVA
ncbi:acyl-CoA dehydrogenase family protein [Sphingomonas sp. MG17]|uniref:Acyl-CoA dehydrogenase family protein n=1 Tax=Sphingomonas tagetis TaxID=2949092 RepID=A0A9X2HPF8_9SPHN|nr:acyl-CoA dehydrogenase family protein [Sphingomonas tagetis]